MKELILNQSIGILNSYAFDDYSDVTKKQAKLSFFDKLQNNNSQLSYYKRLLKNRIKNLKEESKENMNQSLVTVRKVNLNL